MWYESLVRGTMVPAWSPPEVSVPQRQRTTASELAESWFSEQMLEMGQKMTL